MPQQVVLWMCKLRRTRCAFRKVCLILENYFYWIHEINAPRMSDSASPAKNSVVKGKARKLNAPVSAEYDECSSSVIDTQGFSNTRGHSKTQPSLAMSGDTKSREEVARERNRLAQKRFRARQREKLEKQMEEISAKEHERVDLLSEKKDILTTLKANAQLLTVRESLFRLYRTDESPGPVRGIAGPSEGGRELAALPASLGGNMASIVLQSGQGHLASAMTGQIESAEYSSQFVSDAEERRSLSLLSSAEEVQHEFEKRASVVAGMLQRARGSGNSDGLSGLRGDPAFVSAQQKLFSFLWGMFCVNPPLALVWVSKNSTIDEHKYAQAGVRHHCVQIVMVWLALPFYCVFVVLIYYVCDVLYACDCRKCFIAN
jgi:hypothetical protein